MHLGDKMLEPIPFLGCIELDDKDEERLAASALDDPRGSGKDIGDKSGSSPPNRETCVGQDTQNPIQTI